MKKDKEREKLYDFASEVRRMKPTEKTARSWIKLLLWYTANTFSDKDAYKKLIKMNREDEENQGYKMKAIWLFNIWVALLLISYYLGEIVRILGEVVK